MAANSIKAIELISLNTNTLTGNYDLLSSGLPNACILLRFINDSNRDLYVSYDGSTAHDYIVAGTQVAYNVQTNSLPQAYVAMFKEGLPIYVMGTAGGTGYIYVSGYYT